MIHFLNLLIHVSFIYAIIIKQKCCRTVIGHFVLLHTIKILQEEILKRLKTNNTNVFNNKICKLEIKI